MVPILLLSFFALGAIIGSFLNVVVLRYGVHLSSNRSKCFSCGQTLRWFELLPMVSFIIQKGRCRGCKGSISIQYPLVELTTGLVFATVAWKELPLLFSSYFSSSLFIFHISYFIFHLFLWSLLIALSVYDFRHKIIPDALVYGACFISFVLFLLSYFIFHTSSSLDFWAGFLFAAPIVLIWFFSKGRAMGLGDAKLILLFPWFLGFAQGLSALIVGFWIGAAVASGALLLKSGMSLLPKGFYPTFQSRLEHLGMKSELPLGPFLVLGLFVVYVFGWDVTGLSLLLQSNEI